MLYGVNVTREWRKLHIGELYALYVSPHHWDGQIKKNEMGGACGTYWGGGRRGAYRVLVGKA